MRIPRRISSSERARPGIGPRFGDVVIGRGVAGNRDRADVAQLLVGEEAVEVGLAGDAQVVGAAAGGFTLRGERPPVPVRPGGLAPLFGRHAVDRLAHRLPCAAPQRSTRLPGKLLIVEPRVIGAREPPKRILVMDPRPFQRYASPQVAHILFGQLLRKLAFEHRGHRFGVVARLAKRTEHHDFLGRALVHAPRQLGEQALRLARGLGEHALVRGFVLGQVAERGLRRGDLPVLEELAHAQPHVGNLDAVALPHERRELLAALGQLDRVDPHLLRLDERGFVAARDAREPGIAADLDIVAGVVGRLAVEFLPVTALAEHLQPVASHALADIGIAVGGEKRLDLARLGVLQLERKAHVLDPGRQDMALDLLGMARELDRVAHAVGVEHPHDVEVGVLRARGGKGPCRQKHRQQQDPE